MGEQDKERPISMHRKINIRLPLSRGCITLIFLVLTLMGVAVVTPYALLSLFIYGLPALLILAPPVLFGMSILSWVRLREPLPLRWRCVLGAAMGIGLLSLLVLLLGLAGILYQWVWIAILIVMAGIGLTQLPKICMPSLLTHTISLQQNQDKYRYLWLFAAPFLTLAILAASNAPGWIWQEEGYGYDVLEYHLQLPKEYVQAGEISYVPHNVYANFPANVEMLYLLAMVVTGEDVETGVTANFIHLCFGMLMVFAAWVIGNEWSKPCGIICGIAAASTGWLFYFSGLAYVELGMLFFGMTATGAVLRALAMMSQKESTDNSTDGLKWLIFGGLSAGLACGCKYTAVAMILLPLVIAVWLIRIPIKQKWIVTSTIVLTSMITFSPWLIKNFAMTGNPVFPLANTVFQASPDGWGEQENERWVHGHQPSESETSAAYKLSAIWHRVIWDHDQRMGPMLFILALGGLFLRKRDRTDTFLLIIVAVQLSVWLFATHLFARFAVVLLIPLVLLAGRSVMETGSPKRLRFMVILLIVGIAWNFTYAAKLYHRESPDAAPASIIYEGLLPGYEYLDTINNDLPADAHILIVGDAKAFYFQREVDYCVVFNRNEFVETVKSADHIQDVMIWLREKGYTHILVNWSEVRRLSQTYGYSSLIEPGLFDHLQRHGLQLLQTYPHPLTHAQYIELFSIP